MVSAGNDLSQAESDAKLADARGDNAALSTAQTEATSAIVAFQSAAQSYGFQECGRSPVGGFDDPLFDRGDHHPGGADHDPAPAPAPAPAPEQELRPAAAGSAGGGSTGGGTGGGSGGVVAPLVESALAERLAQATFSAQAP